MNFYHEQKPPVRCIIKIWGINLSICKIQVSLFWLRRVHSVTTSKNLRRQMRIWILSCTKIQESVITEKHLVTRSLAVQLLWQLLYCQVFVYFQMFLSCSKYSKKNAYACKILMFIYFMKVIIIIILEIKLRRICWVGHLTCMVQLRNFNFTQKT